MSASYGRRLGILGTLSAALLALSAPAVASADPAPLSPVYGTGTAGAAAGQTDNPSAMSIGPDGSVFVADANNNRVEVYSAQGTFLRAFGFDVIPGGTANFEVCTTSTGCKAGIASADGPGGLNDPTGIAVDASGDVYVSDRSLYRVSEFTSDGSFIRAFGKDVVPGGGIGAEICTTSCKTGVSGPGAGELTPTYVSLDKAGNVYVTESGNERISVFSGTGVFQRAFGWDVIPGGSTGLETCTTATTCKAGLSGGGAGELASPGETIPDASGNLYVADTSNFRVDVFSSAGAFQRAFGWDVIPGGYAGLEACTATCKQGVSGDGVGQLQLPEGVSLDPTGNLDVTDATYDRVSVFTPQGSFIHAFGWDVVPGGSSGFEVCTTTCKLGTSGAGVGQLNSPAGIATDCQGGIFVADSSNHRIQRFGEPGTALTPPCPSTVPPPDPTPTPTPPSSEFTLNKPKLNKKKGTANLEVSLPGPGELTLAGKNIKPEDEQVQAGENVLSIVATGKAKTKLKKKGKFDAKVSVSFTPTGGTANELTRTYKLKRRHKHQH